MAAPLLCLGQNAIPSRDLASSYNAFGFKLLAKTREFFPGKNVFVSPAGLGFALSMAADGARDKTLQEITATLQLAPATALNEANLGLMKELLATPPEVKLEIANSIWVADDAVIKPAFSRDMGEFYQAESANVDFKNPATADRINSWVNDRTHGKIPTMVEPPLNENRLILLDAIYFKGEWVAPFKKELTRDKPFTVADGTVVTSPRMMRSGEFQYFEDDNCQAVRLPYSGRGMSMFVFLPKKSLDDFLRQFTSRSWDASVRQFQSRKGELELPRFKLENEYDLSKVLSALGMARAFSRQADFSGMAEEPLAIGWVKQKTYVDVNEQGTEAAAVSGVGMRALIARIQPPPFRMIVDHPFIAAIRQDQTGDILFLGAIVDPRK